MTKKMLKLFILITAIIAAQSCAYFVNTFDQNRLSQDVTVFGSPDKKLYCEKSPSDQLVNSSPESQYAFKVFITKAQTLVNLKFVDRAVLWSLIQMNLRPDLASPTSKLQVLIKRPGKSGQFEYHHFYSKRDEAYPYLAGLESLLKSGKSDNSLLRLSILADKLFPNVFEVSAEFQNFLESKKKEIVKSPSLKRHYMRADETLKENEKVRKQRLESVVRLYLRDKSKRNVSHEVTRSLFAYESPVSPVTAHCNYDMRLYSSSVYLIHKNFINSHLFGLKSGSGLFLASASQRLEGLSPVANTIFFKGSSQTRSAAFCAFNFPGKNDKNLWMVSTNSRDPGQHIYHLMEYGLQEASTLQEVSDLIGFSRHLFLEDPTRLIFESGRSTNEQLERLLKLNLPVYNARKLGNVWAMHQEGAQTGFVIDERNEGEIYCGKK